MKFLFFYVLSIFSFPAFGAQLIWDFTDRANLESASLVYNQTLGVLHSRLNGVSGASIYEMDVGNGRDGPFNSSTYFQFSDGGDVSGNRIRLNTDNYELLQVTQFELDANWTLEITGSKPLVILSQSDVVISGIILCQGSDGGSAIGGIPGDGGRGQCGGGNGGKGGLPGADGFDGGDVPGAVTGGFGGNYTLGNAVGGGGGGSWNNTLPNLSDGDNSSLSGGGGGTVQSDPGFSQLAAGGGGGGGSGFGAGEAGGGGGGGGGLVLINTARDFYLDQAGEIRAWGGDAGNPSGNAGGGGGGAGGSVLVLAGRDITIDNASFTASNADKGSGGSVGTVDGGTGRLGRSWFTSARNYTAAGGYFPTEEVPFSPGAVEFVNTAQFAESVSFDLLNTRVVLESLTFTPQSDDFLVEVSGSDDDFQTDETGWTTDLTLLERKRYVKIRARIITSNVSEPDMMESITLTYSPGEASEFNFKATGCGLVRNNPLPPGRNGFVLFFLLPLLVLAFEFKTRIQ